MPSRNLEKIYLSDSFYHLYNRGANKQTIFHDNNDCSVFLNLLKRYLDPSPTKDPSGREYVKLNKQLELLAFCLMPNHFHLFIYQHEAGAMTKLLRGVSTSYAAYFNKRYSHSGPIFQSRFKASLINNDAYLTHISRYIHLNPKAYKTYRWSSLPYYLGSKKAEWVKPRRVLELFSGDYENFVNDYEGHKKMLSEIKSDLADA